MAANAIILFLTKRLSKHVPFKKWIGHTNIHTILDTYADVFDKMNNNAIDKLDPLLETIKLPRDEV